jgi:hypothetical protein
MDINFRIANNVKSKYYFPDHLRDPVLNPHTF